MIYRILFSFILFLILSNFCLSQQIKAPRLYSELLWTPKLDSLKVAHGKDIQIDSAYSLATHVALIHYPELQDSKIELISKPLNTSMAARPKGLNVLRRKGKRKYAIYISQSLNTKVPVDSANFNAQVGVIGHEIAHLIYYENISSFRIICNGFGYLNKKFRRKFERDTDQRTIDHGLGWQCFDWSFFVYHYQYTPKEYIDYKEEIYMKYTEIEEQLQEP